MTSALIKNNPLIKASKYKYGAIPFDEIKLEHYMPALDYAIEKAQKKYKGIGESDRYTLKFMKPEK